MIGVTMKDDIAFPKPEPKQKAKRKRLPPVRKGGKRIFNREQHEKRKQHEMLYRRVVRPQFLLDVAREQGRLTRTNNDIPGDTPQEKLRNITPQEMPLCQVQSTATSCSSTRHLATEVHHKMGRDRRKHEPHLLTNTAYFTGVCPECHRFIEANPRWAVEHGYKESRHDRVTTGADYDV